MRIIYKHFQINKKVCATSRCSLTKRTSEEFSSEITKIKSSFIMPETIASEENIDMKKSKALMYKVIIMFICCAKNNNKDIMKNLHNSILIKWQMKLMI